MIEFIPNPASVHTDQPGIIAVPELSCVPAAKSPTILRGEETLGEGGGVYL
jgi:hypothetical protein